MVMQVLFIAVWTPTPQQKALSILVSFCTNSLSRIVLPMIRFNLVPCEVKRKGFK